MKFTLVVLISTLAFCLAQDTKYTTKYDNVDLDEILRNKRLLKNYANCLLETGKCTPDGQELKGILPDALQTGCTKCNERQREGAKRIISHLFENEQELFKDLEKIYDPSGEYRKKYEKEIRSD